MIARALVLVAALLTLAFAPVAAACTQALDEGCGIPGPSDGPIGSGKAIDCAQLEPGEPGGANEVAILTWFVKDVASITCVFGGSVQDSTLLHGGSVVHATGAALSGAPPESILLARHDAYALGSDAWDDACVWLVGHVGCI